MIIHRITIESLDDMDFFEASFDSRLVLLSGHEAEAVLKAIGIILKWRRFADIMPKARIYDHTRIQAEISVGNNTFCISAKGTPFKKRLHYSVQAKDVNPSSVDFFSAIRQSAEEDRLSCFSIKSKDLYPDRFKWYKDMEKFYRDGEFSEITDGMGTTRFFRACLNNFIRHFKPEQLVANKEFTILLRENGSFTVEHSGFPGEQVTLSETESTIFHYLCFLHVNAFWREIECIRDIHHTEWPLFVMDFADHIEHSVDISPWIQRTLSLNRQTFFVCDAAVALHRSG